MTVLYHYCDTPAFVSIIESRSIWLSSLALSNDTMEGRIVNRVIMELAREDGLSGYPMQRLEQSVGLIEKMFDGLGFCLSEDGDLLSQWRGYAADATGLSIGFSKACILRWVATMKRNKEVPAFTLHKVEYKPEMHRAQVAPTYSELRRLIDAGAFKMVGVRGLLDTRADDEIKAEEQAVRQADMELFITLLRLFPKLFSLKAYGFREEREWRLVSTVIHELNDICDYRAASGHIVPYKKFDFIDLKMNVVDEVVLGPKHSTPPEIISAMLKRNGFEGVRVRRSEATYR